MIIDLPHMEEKAFENFKGGEGVTYGKMYFDGVNRILQARLPVGASIGIHTHDTNSEIMLILSGKAKIIMDGEEMLLTAGQVHYCPKGHTHTTIAVGDEELHLYAVVPEQ